MSFDDRSKGFYFIYKVNKSQKVVMWMFRKATQSSESRKYTIQCMVKGTKGILLAQRGLNGNSPVYVYTQMVGCSTEETNFLFYVCVFLQKSVPEPTGRN